MSGLLSPLIQHPRKRGREKAEDRAAFRDAMYGGGMSPEEADKMRDRKRRKAERSTAQVATVLGGEPTGQMMGG